MNELAPRSYARLMSSGMFEELNTTMGSRFTQPGDQEPGAGVFVSHLPFGGASGNDATILDLELDPFTIVNFNIGVENDRFNVEAYCANCTDIATPYRIIRLVDARAGPLATTNVSFTGSWLYSSPRTGGSGLYWNFFSDDCWLSWVMSRMNCTRSFCFGSRLAPSSPNA